MGNHIESKGLSQLDVWNRDSLSCATKDYLADEVPVALIYNGISHVVMMATPKDLEVFAVGFSLSEGIIATPDDIYGIDIYPSHAGIEVQVELSSRRFMALKAQRRALAGRTGCGVCGVEQLQEIGKPIAPLPFSQTFALAQLDRALTQLKYVQPVGQLTGCTHAAAWLMPDGTLAGGMKTWAVMSRWINCWENAASSVHGSMALCWYPAVPAMKWSRNRPCAELKSCLPSLPPPAWRCRWRNAVI